MRKFFILIGMLIAALILAGSVNAAPFLGCDPYPSNVTQPSEFEITEGATVVVSPAVAVTGGVGLRQDMAGTSAGTHNITVKACVTDEWGRSCSTATPLSFTRKSPPMAPAGVKLEP